MDANSLDSVVKTAIQPITSADADVDAEAGKVISMNGQFCVSTSMIR